MIPFVPEAIQATAQISINLDTTSLFEGAQLMIDILSSPYLLVAGLSLGVAILGAIMGAITRLRF